MCPTELGTIERLAYELAKYYELMCAQINNAGVVPGEPWPDGFCDTDQHGEDLLPSLFDPVRVQALTAQVLSFWESSGKLPVVTDLFSWLESSGGSRAESITTVWSLVMTVGFPLLIASGGADMALRTLLSLSETTEPKDTAQSTSSKSKTESVPGASTDTRNPGRRSGGRKESQHQARKKSPSGSRNPDAPASNSIPTPNLPEKDTKSDQKVLAKQPEID